MQRLRRPARYRLSALVAFSSASLALAATATASNGSAQADEFSNGTSTASAIVSRFAPGVGSLEFGISTGVAVSEVTNKLAQAQAKTSDFGLIGTAATAEDCEGAQYVKPEQLPQPTRADNRNGDASATSDEFGTEGAPFGGGREEATATMQPLARAVATTADATFGPVVSIGGGRAVAVTEIIDGKARQAHATVDATVDIAGIVQLKGLHWEALHRTGADPKAEASFLIGAAAAGGVPLPTEQLGAAQEAINTALATSGIRVELPRVERFQQPFDLIRVTPLRIILEDSPAGKATLGAALNLTRAQREQLFDTVVGVYCPTATALLVGDIAISVAAGTGFFVVDVGGADATTAEVRYESPFGAIGGALPSLTPSVEGVPGAVVPGTPTMPGTPPSADPGNAIQPAVSSGPLEELCESVHPLRWPSCSHGAAGPLGLLGLIATVGVGALDWRHQRRFLAARSTAAAV